MLDTNMDTDSIHLCYFTDENYWYPVLVSAFSAGRHLSGDANMVVHILHNGLRSNSIETIQETLNSLHKHISIAPLYIDETPYKCFPAYHNTWMVYLRLNVWRYFPDIDWCVMVDGDTLWCQSPEELWKLRDEDYQIIGSHDMAIANQDARESWYTKAGIKCDWARYFCAGFFLFNLARYRREHLHEQTDVIVSTFGMPPTNEQDLFNIVCREKTLLPLKWGVFAKLGYIRDVSRKDIGCIHYVGDLPWKRDKLKNLSSDLIELWWKETKLLNIPLPQPYQGIHNACKYWILRLLYKIWKNSSFLWNIKYLFLRFGNEWPKNY